MYDHPPFLCPLFISIIKKISHKQEIGKRLIPKLNKREDLNKNE